MSVLNQRTHLVIVSSLEKGPRTPASDGTFNNGRLLPVENENPSAKDTRHQIPATMASQCHRLGRLSNEIFSSLHR